MLFLPALPCSHARLCIRTLRLSKNKHFLSLFFLKVENQQLVEKNVFKSFDSFAS